MRKQKVRNKMRNRKEWKAMNNEVVKNQEVLRLSSKKCTVIVSF